jgi:TonB family protein
MNAGPTVPAERSWPWHRWALFIGLVFAAHVGFLFAFGGRQRVTPRAIVNAPMLQFTTYRSEREQLDDPTLFAMPHLDGFAGAAWMRPPRIEFAPFRWTEPPRLLPLSGAELGATFLQRQRTNHLARLELDPLPPPALTQPKLAGLNRTSTRQSTPNVGGALAQRHWLNAPTDLPPQPAPDLLTNSVVQVWVEPDGQILSAALLLPGSGSKAADQLALKIARTAQFAPLRATATNSTFGMLIFEWQTIPQTNATPVSP